MTMSNIYDTANQLERELRDLEAYKSLKEILANIQDNPESRQLYQDFRQATQDYQMKLMDGQEVSEETLASLQSLTESIKEDSLISKLMVVEQQVGQVVNDINKIITRPLNDLYEFKG